MSARFRAAMFFFATIPTLFCGALICRAEVQSEAQDTVKEPPKALQVDNFGTVDVYESVNGERFYIAPAFMFGFVDVSSGEIAKTSATLKQDKKAAVQMTLQVVTPDVRDKIAWKLSVIKNVPLNEGDVGNLIVDSLTVDLATNSDRDSYGFREFVLLNPATELHSQLPITFEVDSDKADKFVTEVSKGNIDFRLTYTFNKINIDKHVQKIDMSHIFNTGAMRKLTQSGAEIVSAQQMAQALAEARAELVAEEFQSLGKIDQESMPIGKLLEMINLSKTWEMQNDEIHKLEERIHKEHSLNIDPKDFHPVEISKNIASTLNSDTDVAKQRQAYRDEFNKNKSSWTASASASASGSYGFGDWNTTASATYGKEIEKVTNEKESTQEQFRQHVESRYGVTYVDKEFKWRGLEVCDVQAAATAASTRIMSVTIKPTLKSGVRSTISRPSIRDVLINQLPIKFISGGMSMIDAEWDGELPSVLGTRYRTSKGRRDFWGFVATNDNRARWLDFSFAGDEKVVPIIATSGMSRLKSLAADVIVASTTATPSGVTPLPIRFFRYNGVETQELGKVEVKSPVRGLGISEDGRFLVGNLAGEAGAQKSIVNVWRVSDSKRVLEKEGQFGAAGLSSDGALVVLTMVGKHGAPNVTRIQVIRISDEEVLYDYDDEEIRSISLAKLSGVADPVLVYTWDSAAADFNSQIGVTRNYGCRVVKLSDKGKGFVVTLPTGLYLRGVDTTEDGSSVLIGRSDGELSLWNSRTSECKFRSRLSKGLGNVVLSRDGSRGLVGYGDGAIAMVRLSLP